MTRRTWIIVSFAALIIVALGTGYAVYFAQQANAPHTAPGAAKNCGTPIPTTGLRTFRIVPNGTTAAYKVHENLILHNLPSTDATGRTQHVQGDFLIRTNAAPLVANMKITVDLSTLQTDESMRDRYVREHALETATYPQATFVSTCAQGLPAHYSDGQTVTFQTVGNLTMHGVTNKETFNVQGKLAGNTITGTATTTIFMSDFKIQPPNLANIAIAENKAIITIAFTAKEG